MGSPLPTGSLGEGRPLLRGLSLVNSLNVLGRLLGQGFLDTYEAGLTADQRALYRAGFIATTWYDDELQARMFELVAADHSEFEQFALGVAISRHNLTTVQRFLARVASPRLLLRRTAALWSYWRNTGVATVEQFAEGSTVVTIEYPTMTRPGYGLIYGGAAAYMVAVTGAPNTRMRVDVVPGSRVTAQVRWSKRPASESEPGFHSVDAALARYAAAPR
jgi:hypothetical protein